MRATRLLLGCVGAGIASLAMGCEPSASAPPPQAAPAPSAAAAPAAGSSQADLAAAIAENDPFERARKLSELLPRLGADAIPAVKDQLLRTRALLGGAEFELLTRFWARHEPKAATNWAFGLTAPTLRTIAVNTVVEEWAKQDPEATLAGTATLIRKDTDRTAVWVSRVALTRGWFARDRAALEAYIRGLGVTATREEWVLAYVVVLGQDQGADALMRWAEALPADDEPFKRSAYHHVTTFISGFDPAAARRWCDANCEGPYAVGMRATVALTALRSGGDPKALVEWLTQAPSNPENDQTLVTAYATWARRDRDAALAWMRERLGGSEPWLRKLQVPYARNLAQTAPAEAIELAKSAEPEAAREPLMIDIARAWRQQDEAAAEAWLSASTLSEQARESARTVPEQQGTAPL
jgi:hypothetical protein